MNEFAVCLLDDDEAFLSEFGRKLTEYLSTLPYSFSVSSFSRASELEKSAAHCQPDLIISDIQLAGEAENGIELLHRLRKQGCTADLIFLTGYLDFAPDVFEVRPLYFILKSEFAQRIPKAIDLFLEKKRKAQNVLSVTFRNKTELIPVEDVLYCEHSMRKTMIVCKDRQYSVTTPLPRIAQDLPAGQFAFIHQSILVNLSYVARFGKTEIVLMNETKLPISRSQSSAFRQAMAEYLSE